MFGFLLIEIPGNAMIIIIPKVILIY